MRAARMASWLRRPPADAVADADAPAPEAREVGTRNVIETGQPHDSPQRLVPSPPAPRARERGGRPCRRGKEKEAGEKVGRRIRREQRERRRGRHGRRGRCLCWRMARGVGWPRGLVRYSDHVGIGEVGSRLMFRLADGGAGSGICSGWELDATQKG